MTLWPLTLLLLCTFAGATITIDQLSYSAQRPYLRGLQSEKGFVFSSMCIGSDPELVRRCIISAARWRYVVKERDIPLIYYTKDLPPDAISYLKSLHNVFVVELAEMEWLASEHYPVAPPRFYSFYKLAVFNLYGYRVLWFDSDAYLFQSPTFLFDLLPNNATGEEVVAWKAAARNHFGDYFNSGIMVFKPTRKVTQRIYEIWASGNFSMHSHTQGGKELKRLTEQEVLLSAFTGHLIPLPNCLNFRSHAKYSMINRGCNISRVVAFHDWEAFASDMARFCFYWKKAMLLGSSPLLCDVDTLAEGAPRFTLDDCSPYFTPPSKTNLCDPTSPYSPSFRPTEEEIREHFSSRRRQMRALEALQEKMNGLEKKEEQKEPIVEKQEEKVQVLTFTYNEKTDPTSEHYVEPPKVLKPHLDIKHALEKNGQEGTQTEISKDLPEGSIGGGEEKKGDQSSSGGDGKHHYLDKFRHHDQQQEKKGDGDGVSGGGNEEKKEQSSGGDGKHHFLDKFRHHDQQKSEGSSGGSEEKKGDQSSSGGDGKHHYLDKFRHHDQQEKKGDGEGLNGGGNEEKKEQSSGGEGKHHFRDKFRQEQREGGNGGGDEEKRGDQSGRVEGKHHFLDKFRHHDQPKKND